MRALVLVALLAGSARADSVVSIGVRAAYVPGASAADSGRWLGAIATYDLGSAPHVALHAQLSIDGMSITRDIGNLSTTQETASVGLRFDTRPRGEATGLRPFVALGLGCAVYEKSSGTGAAVVATPLDVGVDFTLSDSAMLRIEGMVVIDEVYPAYFLALAAGASIAFRL